VPDDQTLQSQIDAQKRLQAAGQALVAHAQGQGLNPAGADGPIQGKQGGQQPAGQAGSGGQGPGPAAQAQGRQAPSPTPARHADFAQPVNAFAPSRGVPNG
jgi:hypothetical protein